MPLKAFDVLKEPFPQDKAAYTTRKNLFARVFFKKRKKVLRGVHAKLSSLAHFLLIRLRRSVVVILFHHIRLYLFCLLDEILYYQIQRNRYNQIF